MGARTFLSIDVETLVEQALVREAVRRPDIQSLAAVHDKLLAAEDVLVCTCSVRPIILARAQGVLIQISEYLSTMYM